MVGSAKVDAKTGKLISADLGVKYSSYLAGVKSELNKMRQLDGKATRTLRELGITNRPLKESDQKKLAAAPDAAALIKEFEALGNEISGQYHAYEGSSVRDEEKKARAALAKDLAKETVENINALKERIEGLQDSVKTLETAMKELEDEIGKATKKDSDDFFKELDKCYVEGKKFSDAYTGREWDFSVAKKNLKKK